MYLIIYSPTTFVFTSPIVITFNSPSSSSTANAPSSTYLLPLFISTVSGPFSVITGTEPLFSSHTLIETTVQPIFPLLSVTR